MVSLNFGANQSKGPVYGINFSWLNYRLPIWGSKTSDSAGRKRIVLNCLDCAILSVILLLFAIMIILLCTASRSLLEGDAFFQVPEIIDELSTRRVLAMELVQGVPLDRCVDLDQETRNQVYFIATLFDKGGRSLRVETFFKFLVFFPILTHLL